MKQILIPNLASIDRAANEFVTLMGTHRVFAISGELGAGKTTFIRAVCRLLGVVQTVNSPSFAIINEYFDAEGDSIYHFDLYRIEQPVELLDIGYEDYIYSGYICFIEWPEKAPLLIPEDALQVKIEVQNDKKRRVIIKEP